MNQVLENRPEFAIQAKVAKNILIEQLIHPQMQSQRRIDTATNNCKVSSQYLAVKSDSSLSRRDRELVSMYRPDKETRGASESGDYWPRCLTSPDYR